VVVVVALCVEVHRCPLARRVDRSVVRLVVSFTGGARPRCLIDTPAPLIIVATRRTSATKQRSGERALSPLIAVCRQHVNGWSSQLVIFFYPRSKVCTK